MSVFVPSSAVIVGNGRGLFGPGGDVSAVASANFLTSTSLPVWLTHLRAGNAMLFDSAGKLTYAPNNLLTQSNTFSNAAWTLSTATLSSGVTDPLGGANAWTLTATGAGALLFQNVTVPTSANGLFAIYVKRRTGSGAISLRQPAGAYSAVTVTGSWTQVSVVGPGNGAVNTAIQIATSGDAIDIYAATLSAVTYETSPRAADQVITTSAAYYGPRFDYDPATLQARGLLIEESRTNVLKYSSDLSDVSGWSLQQVTGSSDGTLFLDGSAFRKYTAQAGSGFSPQIYPTAYFSGTGGALYAQSWYVKGGTNNYAFVALNQAINHYIAAVFDISGTADVGATQTIVGGSSGTITSATAKYLGGGMFRLTLVGSVANSGNYATFAGLAKAASGNTYDGYGNVTGTFAGSESIYLSSPQFEPGSFATSYIPTGASSVTRAADVVQLTGTALTALQGAQGSVVLESGAGTQTVAANGYYIGKNGSGGMSPASNTEQNINSLTATIGGSGNFTTGNVRSAFSWSGGGSSLVANNGTLVNNASSYSWGGTVYLGSSNGASGNINSYIRSLAIYNTRLPDATLQAKSSVGASY